MALFDYTGQEGDLSFCEGDIITVVNQEADTEWWEGSLNGICGMFPANYVEVKESSTVNQVVEPSTPPAGVAAATIAPVEHFAQV